MSLSRHGLFRSAGRVLPALLAIGAVAESADGLVKILELTDSLVWVEQHWYVAGVTIITAIFGDWLLVSRKEEPTLREMEKRIEPYLFPPKASASEVPVVLPLAGTEQSETR